MEGLRPVTRLASGVTASAALIEAAREAGADAILVHHGWFWNGESPCLVGPKGRRVAAPDRVRGQPDRLPPAPGRPPYPGQQRDPGRSPGDPGRPAGGRPGTGSCGPAVSPPRWTPRTGPSKSLGSSDRAGTLIRGSERPVERLAWCTGGGQGHIEAAAALGVDAFLSGEISEQTTHLARELGIGYLAAGHHATERYGVAALGDHLAERFDLEHRFIEIDNPA